MDIFSSFLDVHLIPIIHGVIIAAIILFISPFLLSWAVSWRSKNILRSIRALNKKYYNTSKEELNQEVEQYPYKDIDIIKKMGFSEFCTIVDNHQRILLHGANGTGKTNYINFFLSQKKAANIIYLKAWEHDRVEDPLVLILNKILKVVAKEKDKEEIVSYMHSYIEYINKPMWIKFNGNTHMDHLRGLFKKVQLKESIIFVVDEIDRTRPSFFIEIMEILTIIFEFNNFKDAKLIYVSDNSILKETYMNEFNVLLENCERFSKKYYDVEHELSMPKTESLIKLLDIKGDSLFSKNVNNYLLFMLMDYPSKKFDFRKFNIYKPTLEKLDPEISFAHYSCFIYCMSEVLGIEFKFVEKNFITKVTKDIMESFKGHLEENPDDLLTRPCYWHFLRGMNYKYNSAEGSFKQLISYRTAANNKASITEKARLLFEAILWSGPHLMLVEEMRKLEIEFVKSAKMYTMTDLDLAYKIFSEFNEVMKIWPEVREVE